MEIEIGRQHEGDSEEESSLCWDQFDNVWRRLMDLRRSTLHAAESLEETIGLKMEDRWDFASQPSWDPFSQMFQYSGGAVGWVRVSLAFQEMNKLVKDNLQKEGEIMRNWYFSRK
jgi:hypothetical protein